MLVTSCIISETKPGTEQNCRFLSVNSPKLFIYLFFTFYGCAWIGIGLGLDGITRHQSIQFVSLDNNGILARLG